MNRFPKSAYIKTRGLVYFARMLDKMRMLQAKELPKAYLHNMQEGFNGRCLRFLSVSYDEIFDQVKDGKSDDEILEWCYQSGRKPTEEEVLIWNQFMEKRGWRDDSTEGLEAYKAESLLAHRKDIVTFFDYYDVDEGRKA